MKLKNVISTECVEAVTTEGLKSDADPDHGKLLSGSTVEFSCAENYVLSDATKTVAECLENGNWDISAPICVKGKLKVFILTEKIVIC